MAVLEMDNHISNSIDKHNVSGGVFVALSKAFDTLNHERLFCKLEYYGFRGLALHWLKDYLYNQRKYVVFNGCTSHTQSVSCGVLHGSILEPLLFLLYVNDMVSC